MHGRLWKVEDFLGVSAIAMRSLLFSPPVDNTELVEAGQTCDPIGEVSC